jgi:hypothetical protein
MKIFTMASASASSFSEMHAGTGCSSARAALQHSPARRTAIQGFIDAFSLSLVVGNLKKDRGDDGK